MLADSLASYNETMHVVTFSKNLLEPEKETFEEYLKKKLPRLEKRLHRHFDEDTVKLNVTVEKFVRKAAFKVEMAMELPKASRMPLYASEDSRDLRKAIDFATNKLIDQITAAIEKMNHQHERAA